MTASEALALKNATMSEVDTVEGPPTAHIDSLRPEDDRDRIAQSEAPKGQSELIDLLDECFSFVWPELQGDGEMPPSHALEDPIPPEKSARPDETGAQILPFERPQGAGSDDPEINQNSSAMPSTTAAAPLCVEVNATAIVAAEALEKSNIVALPSAAPGLSPESDGNEGEGPQHQKAELVATRTRDPRHDPEPFVAPKSLSEVLTHSDRAAYPDADAMPAEELESLLQFMRRAGGSKDAAFNLCIISQVLGTVAPQDEEDLMDRHRFAAGAAMRGIAPQNEAEGMLAAQMAGLHNLAMEYMSRASQDTTPFAQRREYANLAIKMSRAYNHSYETLNRIRGKVPPAVNVNVTGGAQAAVGVFNHSNQGPSKNAAGFEPSSIEHEPGAPMRRQNPQRQTVSGTGGEGEIEMPHARRRCG
jgi:hypothetical protein